jgi:hypothetical protein
MSLIAGSVVKASGFGTNVMGKLSTNGVQARLNCIIPALGWRIRSHRSP